MDVRWQFALVGLALGVGCADDGEGPDAGTIDAGDGARLVGPEGGRLSTPEGAVLDVPPGALAEVVGISLEPFVDDLSMPWALRPPLLSLSGAARLGPDGLVFSKPARLTLTSSVTLTPGTEYPLFVRSGEPPIWRQSEWTMLADSGGRTVTGTIDHFSNVGFSAPLGREGLFGAFDTSGRPEDIWVRFVNTAVRLSRRPELRRGCCMQPARFDLTMDYVDADTGSTFHDTKSIGEADECAEMVPIELVRRAGGAFLQLRLDTCFEYRDAALAVLPPNVRLDLDEGRTDVALTARYLCMGQPGVGEPLELEVHGVGALDTTAGTTDARGTVRTVYRAPEDAEPQAVTVQVHNRCLDEQTSQHVSATGAIELTRCDGFGGELIARFAQAWPDDHLYSSFDDELSILFTFEVDEASGRIVGRGTGLHRAEVSPGQCQVTSVDAPPFEVALLGQASEEQLVFAIVPTDPASFRIDIHLRCDDTPIDVPGYGYLLASIMGQDILFTLPRGRSGYATGYGTEGFGEDPPFDYEWNIAFGCD